MPTTTHYGLLTIAGVTGYVKPSEWDAVTKSLDWNLGELITNIYGDVVLSGFVASGVVLDVTISPGSGFAGPCFLESFTTTTITISNTNGTYKIYLAVADKTAGTFTVTPTTGSVPTGAIYVADVVVSGGVITTVTDKRSVFKTVAGHTHTGGLDGPQITNAGIASGAAIAYSKLNLAGSLQWADHANKSAKTEVKEEGVVVRSDIHTFNFIGQGVSAAVDGTVTNQVNVSIPGTTLLDELNDVTIASPLSRQFIRHNGTVWVNETLENTISGSSGSISATSGGATVRATITHSSGNWLYPPVPSFTMTGDDAEITLDLGKPFNNTEFSVIVKNYDASSPTNIVSFNYTRKGIKA